MYKRIKGKKFGRETDQRRAFMRSLAANLILHEKIKTTKVRAKEAGKAVEKLITVAKSNNLAAIRSLAGVLPTVAAQKLVKDIAPRFASRNGGYTRVIKLGQRLKDGSQIAIVEFVQKAEIVVAAKSKGKKGAAKTEVKKSAKVEKEKTEKAPEKNR